MGGVRGESRPGQEPRTRSSLWSTIAASPQYAPRGHFPPPLAEKRMKHTFRMFTKIAGRWSAFLAIVATAGITNISAARADAADAKNLLKAMSDYLAAQKVISFDYDVDLELVSTQQQKIALASSGSLILNRPDKVHLT